VVTAHPSFAMRLLAPRLGDLQARCPGIELDLRASPNLEPIGEREIDVGIRYGPGTWAGLSSARLFGETLFPVIAPAFMRRLPERPEDLANHPLLTHPEFPWRPWFAAAGLDWDEPRGVMTTDESGLLLDLAAGGVGIALARSGLAAPDLLSGRLLRLFDIEVPANYAYWLVWNPASPKLAAIEAFRAWLWEALPDPAIGEKFSPQRLKSSG
jgi:LysR family transcriptional regulator, glycine cleavage system transcriptional activator